MNAIDASTPVMLLGGRENAVAFARNLGRLGVTIYASGKPGCRSMNSRFCKERFAVPEGVAAAEFWGELLLKKEANRLKGCIVFAFCDESLSFIETNQEELSRLYVLEEFVAEQRRVMLDKQATLVRAREVGVPTPAFWQITTDEDVYKIRDEVRFPVMVKPLNSYAFIHDFGAKLFIIEDDFEEVIEKTNLARSRGHDVMVVEMVPGPDTLLSSYYTYRTPSGERLYDYTKSVIRRWPLNRGGGTFHQSEWLPETAELGWKLFDGVDWQGIANVEFKKDPRDGKLKIIEVNARFTAAHKLVTAAGANIDEIIYCYLTGQNVPGFDPAKTRSMRMWYPIRDFMAYRELSGLNRLSFFGWLKSVFAQKFVISYFSLTDPGPSIAEAGANIARAYSKLKQRIFRRKNYAN